MAKKPDITTIATGYYSRQALNANFENLQTGFDNTLSLDGSTPNAMSADLDMNGNSISNASSITINGEDVVATTAAALLAAQTSLAAAQTAETNAEASEVASALSETNAATSETNASSSATAANTSAVNAATSETNSSASASASSASAAAALASETAAAASESIATTSASAAATSATAASSSASTASAASDAALAALDSFDDRYLGQKASDPTLDNDGDPLVAGALYFNTSDDIMKVFDGSLWVAAYASLSGAMFGANNLSDVADVTASRTNLGLGSAATTDSTDYATATQGSLADSSVQPAALGTAAYTASTDYATAAQGTLADSAVQPSDNVSTLTNDAGYTANVGTITGVTAGGGITGGGTSGSVTIDHADTSAQASVSNSGTTVIQDITLDTYGHITALGSTTLSIPADGLGVGQTWQNVIGSRSGSDTAYQNTTGKPICVYIEDDTNADFSVSSNGSTWMDFPLVNGFHPLSAVIPDGYYYRWSGPSPAEWLELR